MGKKQKFYVVWKGVKPGVYKTWEECKQQINAFEGARYKSYESEGEANLAFHHPEKVFAKKAVQPKFVYPSISVDAACSGNPGVMEYRGVDTKTGVEIFKKGPFPDATNNIGEFLAIVHALALMKNQQTFFPIYTDSMTALSWVKNKKAKTKLERTEFNKEVFVLIQRAELWLINNPINVPLMKWPTDLWGEIPADFGRK
ncbi:MAG: ribonuclease H family protein [Bacteroidales bacterium]|nr:ribonuclease H family protein [Bacteroidales bacterium]MDY0216261.1 ribonuclease H family protein [Bacteroidales bacterium]